jgi:hypothetical protein
MFNSFIPDTLQDFLSRLLDRNLKSRLGYGSGAIEEIKSHCWFKNINWEKLRNLGYPLFLVPPEKNMYEHKEKSLLLTPSLSIENLNNYFEEIQKKKHK